MYKKGNGMTWVIYMPRWAQSKHLRSTSSEKLTHGTFLVPDAMSELCWPWCIASSLREPQQAKLWLTKVSCRDKSLQWGFSMRVTINTLCISINHCHKGTWDQSEHGSSCCDVLKPAPTFPEGPHRYMYNHAAVFGTGAWSDPNEETMMG